MPYKLRGSIKPKLTKQLIELLQKNDITLDTELILYPKYGDSKAKLERLAESIRAAAETAELEAWTTIEKVYETRWDCSSERLVTA